MFLHEIIKYLYSLTENLEAIVEIPRKNCYDMHIFIVLFTVNWKDKDILTFTGHQIKRFPYPQTDTRYRITAKSGHCTTADI